LFAQRLSESQTSVQQRLMPRGAGTQAIPLRNKHTHPVLHLQRMLGNRGVARLVQAERLPFEGKLVGIQRKLMAGAAGDQYEQEADAVARQVLGMSNAAVERSMERAAMPEEKEEEKLKTQAVARVQKTQRQATVEEDKELLTKPLGEKISRLLQPPSLTEEDQEELVQPKQTDPQTESFAAGDFVETQLTLSKEHGSPLPEAVRGFMEPRFGQDFSSVRMHTGGCGVHSSPDRAGPCVYIGEEHGLRGRAVRAGDE
jgi:hypothetical protein